MCKSISITKIICVCIIVSLGLGCVLSSAKSDYRHYSRQTLEQKAGNGDLRAAFWLGDSYFLGENGPQDTDKAFSNWYTVTLAIEKDPAVVAQPWFKQTCQNHHPIAVAMQLFHFCNVFKQTGSFYVPLEEFGQTIDVFLMSREQYPQYEEFFIQATELMQILGEMTYLVGQKYYDDHREYQEVYPWAERACKLKNTDGCVLALKTF